MPIREDKVNEIVRLLNQGMNILEKKFVPGANLEEIMSTDEEYINSHQECMNKIRSFKITTEEHKEIANRFFKKVT